MHNLSDIDKVLEKCKIISLSFSIFLVLLLENNY